MGIPRDDRTAAESVPETVQLPGEPVTGPVPAELAPTGPAHKPGIRPTRISGTWVAVIVAIFVLIFLLVFILQNLAGVTVNFLGGSAALPLGVALLFASIAGALLVALVGAARIMQLRRQAKRALK